MTKNSVRVTALLSAIACGALLVTTVPQALAQGLNTTPTAYCYRGQTSTIPTYVAQRRAAQGLGHVGACSSSTDGF